MENKLEIAGNTIIGIESGDVTEGHWIKFSDGTMIQSGVVDMGSMSHAGERLIQSKTFPFPFINASYNITLTLNGAYMFASGAYQAISVSRSSVGFSAFFTSAEKISNVGLHYIAIGRWK